jgi:hypothetical protein
MSTSDYITLTRLGEIYGVGARDVGRWLKGLGLREQDGRPSRDAIQQEFVRDRPLEHGGYFWLWHEKKTCEVLDGMCYPRAEQMWSEIEEYEDFTVIRGKMKGKKHQ